MRKQNAIPVASNLSCEPLEPDSFHMAFVYDLLTSEKNIEALRLRMMQPGERKAFYQEMKVALQSNDPDEAHFIVCQGTVLVAWLKINGLQGDRAWISMLVVHERFQRQGIGSFSIGFAEVFAKSKGIAAMGIHTTTDNIPARDCYQKLGYAITEESEGQYTFFKRI